MLKLPLGIKLVALVICLSVTFSGCGSKETETPTTDSPTDPMPAGPMGGMQGGPGGSGAATPGGGGGPSGSAYDPNTQFSFADSNSDGKISGDEMASWMAPADKDGDGEVSREEFMEFRQPKQPSEAEDKQGADTKGEADPNDDKSPQDK